jgi:hypothetical protein
MKQVIVGVYYLGDEQVEIVLREDTGGEFYSLPEKGKVPRIKLGADYKDWDMVVRCLLHEVMEMVMFRNRCRYNISGDYSADHSAYMFLMNHTEFSDMCGKLAEFLVKCLPDLATAWKKWERKQDRK